MTDLPTAIERLRPLAGVSPEYDDDEMSVRQGDIKAILTELDRLRAGIQAMLDGDYPHPRAYRSAPSMACPHGRRYYEECSECSDAWLRSLLA